MVLYIVLTWCSIRSFLRLKNIFGFVDVLSYFKVVLNNTYYESYIWYDIDDWECAWWIAAEECKWEWWDPGIPRCGACPWVEGSGSREVGGGGGGNWEANWLEWWLNNEVDEEDIVGAGEDEKGDVMEAVVAEARLLEVRGGGEEGDIEDEVGHWNWLFAPDISMSRINVSMGVFPTSRTKKSCSITVDETVRRDGRRNKSFPNRVGWFGYCVRQYSSKAHCDFSCNWSIVWDSVSPHASTKK